MQILSIPTPVRGAVEVQGETLIKELLVNVRTVEIKVG
jgi:hypothetical protein